MVSPAPRNEYTHSASVGSRFTHPGFEPTARSPAARASASNVAWTLVSHVHRAAPKNTRLCIVTGPAAFFAWTLSALPVTLYWPAAVAAHPDPVGSMVLRPTRAGMERRMHRLPAVDPYEIGSVVEPEGHGEVPGAKRTAHAWRDSRWMHRTSPDAMASDVHRFGIAGAGAVAAAVTGTAVVEVLEVVEDEGEADAPAGAQIVRPGNRGVDDVEPLAA